MGGTGKLRLRFQEFPQVFVSSCQADKQQIFVSGERVGAQCRAALTWVSNTLLTCTSHWKNRAAESFLQS